MYNTADRKEIRKAEKAAKIAERQRRDVISGLMSSNPGRAWMLEILERCHLFQTSFDTNAAITAFREGERNIGAQFLSDIMRACPDQFMLMMRERNERDIARDAA